MEIKITRRKISEQVLDQLIAMIKDGKFPVNEPLPSENQLAEMFGVSRAPVREALSVLSASGIIESRQGGRSYVKEMNLSDMYEPLTFEVISIKQILELLEMRVIIEANAAGLAAKRRTNEELKHIEKTLSLLSRTVEDNHIVGDQADVQFHKEIMKASHNSFLIQVMENIDDLYRKSIAYSLKKNVGIIEKRQQVYHEHKKIYEAIRDQNADEASNAMKEHLQNAMKKLKALEQKNM
ncbi:FadR/GntR family transcriptional regulator [Bacillus alveayuensis]|jgi:GntR family transcriptional repressor for pyruvate dehydrogenase complex|uniref:GntR family transcriptional repressor for pyruvate dehydrogenase complex n=1 Tax=Aeribacillus alveayuensis TaxID=279215 RepID=A0ABT9VS44_9BACI|nr:FadR/GntR family transcriptional regulator [Bacillus alveayuensis]MDQ0163813.1 GntR family transcriptional repressor for pyruvate dehydrogenase complex [Bacillus alveayuensis]